MALPRALLLLPLLLLTLVGLVALVGRSAWHRSRYGTWGWSLRRGHVEERPIQVGSVLLVGGLVAEVLLWALGALPPQLLAFEPTLAAEIAGSGLAVLALVLVVLAQLQMGASWRVGIEADAHPGLIRHGLYGFSRNPIYLFILVALAGFVLLIPAWPSLALFAAALFAVRAQVLQEERYLLRHYGDGFRSYRREVGRFVPLLGRVP